MTTHDEELKKYILKKTNGRKAFLVWWIGILMKKPFGTYHNFKN
jgi:hypothetical protein